MSTASSQPTRGSWYQRTFTTRRPYAPLGVRAVTTTIIIFAILGLIRSAMLLVGGIVAVTDGESPGLVAALAGGSLVVGIFYLWLAYKTRRGRRWAWITMLTLLSLLVVLGLAIFASGLATDDDSGVVGLAVAAVPLVMILLLTAPRGSRDYFLRPQAYSGRWHGTPVADAPMMER
jgi:hypothetical protein